MTSVYKVSLCTTLVSLGLGYCHADHAMLTDGRLLYNVTIPDGATTGGQLVRIRTSPMSFEYDPANNIVVPLPRHSVTKRLADYVTTSVLVGRNEAVALVQKRNWDVYVPPARPVLVAPTPAPKATPVPVHLAKAPPVQLNVVSDKVPLAARLDTQLEIFMKEQGDMSRDAVTSVVQGKITPEQSKNAKLGLLNQQKNILEQYFPAAEETVKTAINYWTKQLERVEQTGRFDLEEL